jgi:hypothetical protein
MMKKLFKLVSHFGSVLVLSLIVAVFSGFFGKNKHGGQEGQTTLEGLLGAESAYAELPGGSTPGTNEDPGSDCESGGTGGTGT